MYLNLQFKIDHLRATAMQYATSTHTCFSQNWRVGCIGDSSTPFMQRELRNIFPRSLMHVFIVCLHSRTDGEPYEKGQQRYLKGPFFKFLNKKVMMNRVDQRVLMRVETRLTRQFL